MFLSPDLLFLNPDSFFSSLLSLFFFFARSAIKFSGMCGEQPHARRREPTRGVVADVWCEDAGRVHVSRVFDAVGNRSRLMIAIIMVRRLPSPSDTFCRNRAYLLDGKAILAAT